MDIILNAGDARNHALEAVSMARSGDFETAKEKIVQAKEAINKAHCFQTETIQEEARGNQSELSLLFIHAQDTLMTIMSEVKVFEEMIYMYHLILKGSVE